MHPAMVRVGARFSSREQAGAHGTFPQRFAAGAFDGSIDRTVPLRINDEIAGTARIIAADVADDGSSVLFTYEITSLDQQEKT